MIVDVVVPAFGQAALTQRCLRALWASALPDGVSARVVLVDDGTPTETGWPHQREKEALAELGGEVVVGHGGAFIIHDRNRGPHAAWNTGWQRAAPAAKSNVAADAVCFINNDVVVEPRCLVRLVEVLSPERPYTCAREVQAAAPDMRQLVGLADGARVLYPGHFNACFAVKRQLLVDLDGFDESMRLAYSDTDFLERMRDRGPRPVIVSNAVCFHGVSVTRKRALGVERDLELEDADRAAFESKWRDRPDVLARHPRVSGEMGRAARAHYWAMGER